MAHRVPCLLLALTLAACGRSPELVWENPNSFVLESQKTQSIEIYEHDDARLVAHVSEWYDPGHHLPGTSTLVAYGHRRTIVSALIVQADGAILPVTLDEAKELIEGGAVELLSKQTVGRTEVFNVPPYGIEAGR